MSAIHLTLRDQRILAGLGKPRAAVDTPYTDRLRLDAIVDREHFAAQRADAKRREVGPPAPSGAAQLFNRYKTLQRTTGPALFSGACVCIAAGAFATMMAKQPVIDEANHRAHLAEEKAARYAAMGSGHVRLNIEGPAHQVARAAQAAAADIWVHQATQANNTTRGTGK